MDWSGVKVSTEVQNGKKSTIRISGMTMVSGSMSVCSGLSLKITFFFFWRGLLVGGHEVFLLEERERERERERENILKASLSDAYR